MRFESNQIDAELARRFRRRLLAWYDANARELPWRRDRDPYRVWVSEIMLQQTRVAAVIDHYQRFLERFPDVEALARGRLSSVLAVWSGLGYYRRARMMHAAAKQIVRDYGGRFPVTPQEFGAAGVTNATAWLRTLPGIGRYTASAIASIAYGEPVAVVDGNVERVLGRMIGRPVTGEEVWRMAAEFLSSQRPGDFNQAFMELGAVVCVPRKPLCLACPVQKTCCTRGELPQVQREKRRKRELHYLLHWRDKSVFLRQRSAAVSLMPDMWELPEIAPNGHKHWLTLRHSITNTDYVIRVVRGEASAEIEGKWVDVTQLPRFPLTGLTRKILAKAELMRSTARGKRLPANLS